MGVREGPARGNRFWGRPPPRVVSPDASRAMVDQKNMKKGENRKTTETHKFDTAGEKPVLNKASMPDGRRGRGKT